MWDKNLCNSIHGNISAPEAPADDKHLLSLHSILSCHSKRSISLRGIAGHYARVFDVAFSPADSSLLASASDDDTCKVWRTSEAGATQAASFHGHSDSVLRVSWAPAGNLLASGMLPCTPRSQWQPLLIPKQLHVSCSLTCTSFPPHDKAIVSQAAHTSAQCRLCM